jgi:hypothetical protein
MFQQVRNALIQAFMQRMQGVDQTQATYAADVVMDVLRQMNVPLDAQQQQQMQGGFGAPAGLPAEKMLGGPVGPVVPKAGHVPVKMPGKAQGMPGKIGGKGVAPMQKGAPMGKGVAPMQKGAPRGGKGVAPMQKGAPMGGKGVAPMQKGAPMGGKGAPYDGGKGGGGFKK